MDPSLWTVPVMPVPDLPAYIGGGSTATTPQPDTLPTNATQSQGFLNVLTGTLGKAFDTALDVAAFNAKAKVIGSVYPTGQLNPASQTVTGTPPVSGISGNTLLVGGAIALGVGLVLFLALRK